ncbi:MAG: hypothetical protein R3C10_00200 [Pirellulales bacterium]
MIRAFWFVWLACVPILSTAVLPSAAAQNASNNRDDILIEVEAEVESPLLRGRRQLENRDYKAAVESFTDAIDNDPNNAAAYDGRSEAYKELASSLSDTSARDQAYLQHVRDREKAAELRFYEDEMPGIVRDAQHLTIALGVVLPLYLGSWVLIGYFARRRSWPIWPVVAGLIVVSMSAGCLPLAAATAIVVAILIGVLMYPEPSPPDDDDVAIDDDPRWSVS